MDAVGARAMTALLESITGDAADRALATKKLHEAWGKKNQTEKEHKAQEAANESANKATQDAEKAVQAAMAAVTANDDTKKAAGLQATVESSKSAHTAALAKQEAEQAKLDAAKAKLEAEENSWKTDKKATLQQGVVPYFKAFKELREKQLAQVVEVLKAAEDINPNDNEVTPGGERPAPSLDPADSTPDAVPDNGPRPPPSPTDPPGPPPAPEVMPPPGSPPGPPAAPPPGPPPGPPPAPEAMPPPGSPVLDDARDLEEPDRVPEPVIHDDDKGSAAPDVAPPADA